MHDLYTHTVFKYANHFKATNTVKVAIPRIRHAPMYTKRLHLFDNLLICSCQLIVQHTYTHNTSVIVQ